MITLTLSSEDAERMYAALRTLSRDHEQRAMTERRARAAQPDLTIEEKDMSLTMEADQWQLKGATDALLARMLELQADAELDAISKGAAP